MGWGILYITGNQYDGLDNAEMTAVTLLVDNNQKVFVRFNDLIGDLAIFPLKRIE